MVLFDDLYEIVHNGVPVRDVPALTEKTFVPRGATALLDAVGKTMNAVVARLADIPADERPENVIVAILTDGQENASREYSLAMVRELIGRFTNELHWDFIFLAATADAFADARRMGISADNTMQFAADADGIHECCCCISEAVEKKRKTGKIGSWKKERRKSGDAGS